MYAVLILLLVIIILVLTLIATVKTVVYPQATIFRLCSKSVAVDACENVPHIGGIQRLTPNASIIFNDPDPNPDLYKKHYDGEHSICVDQSVNPSSNYECRIAADPTLFYEKDFINFNNFNLVDSRRKMIVANSESTGTLVVGDTKSSNELSTMSKCVDASGLQWHEINLNEK